jgi:hypothetical protein
VTGSFASRCNLSCAEPALLKRGLVIDHVAHCGMQCVALYSAKADMTGGHGLAAMNHLKVTCRRHCDYDLHSLTHTAGARSLKCLIVVRNPAGLLASQRVQCSGDTGPPCLSAYKPRTCTRQPATCSLAAAGPQMTVACKPLIMYSTPYSYYCLPGLGLAPSLEAAPTLGAIQHG